MFYNWVRMKCILKLDQHEMGLHSPEDGEITRERTAVRAVALDHENRVALIAFRKLQSVKLAGGGVEVGEGLLEGLRREVREEIGYEVAEILDELGRVEENRYYAQLHQVSYAYLIRVGAFVGTEPTKKEQRHGIETRWYGTLDDAVEAIYASKGVDEDGDMVGRVMMNTRDVAILQAATAVLGGNK